VLRQLRERVVGARAGDGDLERMSDDGDHRPEIARLGEIAEPDAALAVVLVEVQLAVARGEARLADARGAEDRHEAIAAAMKPLEPLEITLAAEERRARGAQVRLGRPSRLHRRRDGEYSYFGIEVGAHVDAPAPHTMNPRSPMTRVVALVAGS